MAAHCQVTGAEPGFGHSISHSHRRNKRRFDPNIQKKRYWVPSCAVMSLCRSLQRASRPSTYAASTLSSPTSWHEE